MDKGLFVTFEGGEGAGKTTLIDELAKTLRCQGRDVLTTREPGGIPIAEQIRGILLDRNHTAMDPRTEALLYAAARRQHLAERVIPALARGAIVICDRFIDSSLAYQGYARGLGIDEIRAVNAFAIGDHMPALTFWLDISPEVGLARVHAGDGREVNRLDLEGFAFHEAVREGYRQLHESDPGRIVRIDAGQAPESVLNDVLSILNARL